MKNNLEYRAYMMEDVKVDKDKRTIVGRAIVYNSMSNELRTSTGDKFKEVIMPGALRESLANNDILAFKEHNPAYLLGRKSAGTLSLEDRADGLYVKIDVPETSYGNDTLISAERGDLRGFSFGFNTPKSRNYIRSGEKIREIESLNLREVSVVANPAYNETTLSVMRNEDFVENLDKEKGEEVKPEPQKEEVRKEEQKLDSKVVEVAPKTTEPTVDRNKDYELKFKFLSLNNK
jgi:HK97 family phage prohead protease